MTDTTPETPAPAPSAAAKSLATRVLDKIAEEVHAGVKDAEEYGPAIQTAIGLVLDVLRGV